MTLNFTEWDYDSEIECYVVYLDGESDHRVEIPYNRLDSPTVITKRIESLIKILGYIREDAIS